MSNDEEQNQDEESPEEENQNTEENTSDVDIDRGNELSEDEAYKQELEKWFEQLEKLHGVAFANEMRTKILLSKQIAHAIDIESWAKNQWEMEMGKIKDFRRAK